MQKVSGLILDAQRYFRWKMIWETLAWDSGKLLLVCLNRTYRCRWTKGLIHTLYLCLSPCLLSLFFYVSSNRTVFPYLDLQSSWRPCAGGHRKSFCLRIQVKRQLFKVFWCPSSLLTLQVGLNSWHSCQVLCWTRFLSLDLENLEFGETNIRLTGVLRKMDQEMGVGKLFRVASTSDPMWSRVLRNID